VLKNRPFHGQCLVCARQVSRSANPYSGIFWFYIVCSMLLVCYGSCLIGAYGASNVAKWCVHTWILINDLPVPTAPFPIPDCGCPLSHTQAHTSLRHFPQQETVSGKIWPACSLLSIAEFCETTGELLFLLPRFVKSIPAPYHFAVSALHPLIRTPRPFVYIR